MKNYKLAVLIGRFQPLHNAHLELILKALSHATYIAIVLGSDSSPRTIKNPFSSEERISIILDSLTEVDPSLLKQFSRLYSQRHILNLNPIVPNELNNLLLTNLTLSI